METTAMRIAVVSDTHGHVDRAQQAARMLESLEVEQVLHCGDIGTMEVDFNSFDKVYISYDDGETDTEQDADRPRQVLLSGNF